MVKNYLMSTWRHVQRHKLLSAINIAGLTVGMTVCILIFLWVWDEVSYDRFHRNAGRIHRLNLLVRDRVWPVVSIPLGPALAKDFPEIESTIRFAPSSSLLMREERRFEEQGGFVDPEFLTAFTFPLVLGDAEQALASPDVILLTEELAGKLFDRENPLGKSVRVNGSEELRVSGVLKNIPGNSSIRFDYLRPVEVFIQRDRDPANFGRFQLETYVLLQSGDMHAETEHKVSGYLDRHEFFGNPKIELEPLTHIHLYGAYSPGDVRYVYIFSLIAAFILAIACFNVTNLSIARTSQRAREIGMRKVTGALRRDLIKQFMGESFFMSLFSMGLAVLLVVLALPAFNSFSGKTIAPGHLTQPIMILGLICSALLAGFLSGIYPAFLMASLKPASILSGIPTTGSRRPLRLTFRKILVVFQFAVTIGLIIATLVIWSQLDYIFHKNLGMDREHVLYLHLRGAMQPQYQALKTDLLGIPGVQSVTASDQLPVEIGHSHAGFEWEGKDPKDKARLQRAAVDFDYFRVMGMEIDQGRAFSREYTTDATAGYVLNQAALRRTEMASPLGMRFAAPAHDGLREGSIIGIVKDFHFQPLQTEIGPLVLLIDPERYQYVFLRTEPNDRGLPALLENLERVWNRFAPEFPFAYHFLDEFYGRIYHSERNTGTIFGYFTLLAVFTSCLGLFGLATQASGQRTKEIGIRKIMGASVPEITWMLSWEFVKSVAFANLIAWPVAYTLMKRWLDVFVYRTSIQIWIFLASAALATLIAILAVSYQSLKAAVVDPVVSLRYE